MVLFRYFHVVFFIFLPFFVFGQPEADNLKDKISQTSGIDRAGLYYRIGKACFPSSPDSSLKYTLQALEIYSDAGDEDEIYRCLSLLTGIYVELSRPDTAIKTGIRVFHWAEKNGRDTMYAAICLELGNAYTYISHKEEKANFYYLIASKSPDEKTALAAYANLGLLFLKAHKADSAAYYFSTALERYREIQPQDEKVMYNTAVLYSNLGSVDYLRGNYQEGIAKIKKSVDIMRKMDNLIFIAIAYNKIGYGFQQSGEKDSASYYFNLGTRISRQNDYPLALSSSYWHLSNLAEENRDFENALHYYKLFKKINDSIWNANAEKEIEKIKLGFDIEAKNQNIELLQSSNKNLRLRGVLLVLFLITLSIILISLINRKRQKTENEKLKAELKLKNTDLEKQKALDNLKLISNRVIEQNLMIEELEKELQTLKNASDHNKIEKKLIELHSRKILTDDDWIEYFTSFGELYPVFYQRVKNFENISEGDRRQLVFIKLGFSIKESSYLLGISTEGVKRARQRLSKKLGLSDASQLKEFVIEMSFENH